MSAGYNSGRALSAEAAAAWAGIVAPVVRSGTNLENCRSWRGHGRFAELFARVLQSAGDWSDEPSTAMLAWADGSAQPKRPAYVAGSAEAIPLRVA